VRLTVDISLLLLRQSQQSPIDFRQEIVPNIDRRYVESMMRRITRKRKRPIRTISPYQIVYSHVISPSLRKAPSLSNDSSLSLSRASTRGRRMLRSRQSHPRSAKDASFNCNCLGGGCLLKASSTRYQARSTINGSGGL
jgi:hypothetical protein